MENKPYERIKNEYQLLLESIRKMTSTDDFSEMDRKIGSFQFKSDTSKEEAQKLYADTVAMMGYINDSKSFSEFLFNIKRIIDEKYEVIDSKGKIFKLNKFVEKIEYIFSTTPNITDRNNLLLTIQSREVTSSLGLKAKLIELQDKIRNNK